MTNEATDRPLAKLDAVIGSLLHLAVRLRAAGIWLGILQEDSIGIENLLSPVKAGLWAKAMEIRASIPKNAVNLTPALQGVDFLSCVAFAERQWNPASY